MNKGKLVSTVLIALAIYLVVTGNWALALFGAIFVQIGRITAMLLERRPSRWPRFRSHRLSS